MSDTYIRRQFLLLWTSDPDGESERADDPKIEEWLAEGDAKGAWQAGQPVAGATDARSVVRRGDDVIVTDGPFPDFKEWFYGFDIVLAHSVDEAVDYASKHPLARVGRAYVLPTVDLEELG
jgi:hypothetical protein